jgi:hypothetical protein
LQGKQKEGTNEAEPTIGHSEIHEFVNPLKHPRCVTDVVEARTCLALAAVLAR